MCSPKCVFINHPLTSVVYILWELWWSVWHQKGLMPHKKISIWPGHVVHTFTCSCYQVVKFGQRAVLLCGWEGNHRSGQQIKERRFTNIQVTPHFRNWWCRGSPKEPSRWPPNLWTVFSPTDALQDLEWILVVRWYTRSNLQQKKINITARTQIQTSHVHITLTGLDTALLVQWQERNPACENLASEIFNNSCLEDFWGTELKLELYPEIYAVKQKTKAVMVGVIVVVVVVVTAEW